MKRILILLSLASLCTANARDIDTPAKSPPALEASDVAWIQGICYTKGLLPNEDGLRLSSVMLVLDYEKGKREVVIDSTEVAYYEGDSEEWKAAVGDLLVSVNIHDGKHEFFLGYTTAKQSVARRKKISLRGVGLPGLIRHFEGRTGSMASDIGYVVPAGESKLFTFVKDGKQYAHLKLIAKQAKSQAVSSKPDPKGSSSANGITISLTPEKCLMNGKEIEPTVKEIVENLEAFDTSTPVLINADPEMPFKSVSSLVELLKDFGFSEVTMGSSAPEAQN